MLVVLKGSALVSQNKKLITVEKSYKIKLNNSSKVILNSNSVALVYNNRAKIEFSNKNITLNIQEIRNTLNRVTKQTLTSNFITYLDQMYKDIEDESHSSGASVGAVYRNSKNEIKMFYPQNGAIILSDSITILFNNMQTKFISNLVISNAQTKEIIYNYKPTDLKVKIRDLTSGDYFWNTQILLNSKVITLNNGFKVPPLNEKIKMIKEINDFKLELNDCSKKQTCFSDEAKQIFLDDFLKLKMYLY
jgi:hypothetical protein